MSSKFVSMVLSAAVLTLATPLVWAAPPAAPAAQTQAGPAPGATSQPEQQWRARMDLMQRQMREFHSAKTAQARAKLLREHMSTMLEQMQSMRSMGGAMMGGRLSGRPMMRGGAMAGGTMGGGMMRGRTASGMSQRAQRAMPARGFQLMQDRMDMMQTMMEQMMAQMQGMEQMYRTRPSAP